ncbi:MAG TPA: phosphoribosylformylglycinamidine synthase subunit PurQ [Bacillus bacterium]|nr:phosphoribosylformylglycinamidine synthase subunit PurQ [Bacillus sp. (in: firmicutes)]
MRFAVIVFPGTSCELDMYHAIKDELGAEVEYVQHTETDLSRFDAIMLPGGASYGNYLRPGAIAAKATNIIKAIIEAAEAGKPVVGVSNGFQILLEAGLLPGAMKKNESLKFICRQVKVEVVNNNTMFTDGYTQGEIITIPIAHEDGNYECDEATLKELEENNQIVLRYHGENPNGSKANIAGIMNKKGNVLGLMPHPERAVDELLGSADGLKLLQSMLKNWRETHVVTP